METVTRPATSWQLPTRTLQLGTRTLVMGVINVTPDSFSDGGSSLGLRMRWRTRCISWSKAPTCSIWEAKARARAQPAGGR